MSCTEKGSFNFFALISSLHLGLHSTAQCLLQHHLVTIAVIILIGVTVESGVVGVRELSSQSELCIRES